MVGLPVPGRAVVSVVLALWLLLLVVAVAALLVELVVGRVVVVALADVVGCELPHAAQVTAARTAAARRAAVVAEPGDRIERRRGDARRQRPGAPPRVPHPRTRRRGRPGAPGARG